MMHDQHTNTQIGNWNLFHREWPRDLHEGALHEIVLLFTMNICRMDNEKCSFIVTMVADACCGTRLNGSSHFHLCVYVYV